MRQKIRITDAASLLCKLTVVLSACIGTYMSWAAGRHSFMGGNSVFMYFTIQSNIAMALICLAGASGLLLGRKAGTAWKIIQLMGTVSITLTGVVFCFVLAPTMGGAAWGTANVLTHVVVPLVSVLDFFVAGSKYDYRKRDAFWVILPPLLYAIFAGIAYVAKWEFAPGVYYPYFFLNWGSEAGAFGFCEGLPFMGCMWWILLLLVFLLIVGRLYLAILRLIQKKNSRTGAEA